MYETYQNPIGISLSGKPQRWKKLLYLNQPYPDNYTDTSFLDQLKTNSTVIKYSYWKFVDDFATMAFYLSTIFLITLIFSIMYNHSVSSICLVTITGAIGVLEVIVWKMISDSTNNATTTIGPSSTASSSKFKSALIIVFIILVISPVLKSLTRSTSSDSIWALSFILFLANLLFHDYCFNLRQLHHHRFYRPIISTNVSLANGIVLASRLNSTVEVFCFLIFTIQLNILLPFFYHLMRKKNFALNLDDKMTFLTSHSTHLLVFTQVIISRLTFTYLSARILFFWYLVQAFILFELPAYFLFLQKYKNEIQGPWDSANPVIRSQ